MNFPILTYEQLKTIPNGENNEPMVDIRRYDPSIVCSYDRLDMLSITGEIIYVRDSVARRLANVNYQLKELLPKATLKVLYGYRHPKVQKRYFDEMRLNLKKRHQELPEEALVSLTHNFIAVPEVAGHPTGGAVDLTITMPEGDLDMGSGIEEYAAMELIQTNASGLSEEQRRNRFILHDLMLSEGFAPFYGEWWHFCYGDREWACFYSQGTSFYSPIDFSVSL